MGESKASYRTFSTVFIFSIILFSSSKIYLKFTSLPEIIIFIIFIFYLVEVLIENKKIVVSAYYWLASLYVVIIIASITKGFFCGYYNFGSMKYVLRIFMYLIIFTLTINLINNKTRVRTVMSSFIAIGIFVGLNAIFQRLIGPSMTSKIQPWGPDWISGYTQQSFRVYSFLDNPIYLGIFAVIWIGLIEAGFFHFYKKAFKNISMFFLIALAVSMIILSGSRTAIVGAIFVSITIILGRLSFKRTVILVIFLVICIFLIQNVFLQIQPIFSHHRTNISHRFLAYQSAINMIKDNPLLGIGMGNYKEVYEHDYKLTAASSDPDTFTAENNFLEMGAQVGLFGLMLYLMFYAFCFKNLYIVYKCNKDSYLRSLALGIGASLVGILASSMFATINTVPLNMILWVFFGLGESLKNITIHPVGENN